MSPQVSWLFFKARAKRPYLSHTGRASNAEKQPTGRGPEGCVENGPAAALLVGYVSIQICALLAPCRRPILNATTSPLYARRYTSLLFRPMPRYPPSQCLGLSCTVSVHPTGKFVYVPNKTVACLLRGSKIRNAGNRSETSRPFSNSRH